MSSYRVTMTDTNGAETVILTTSQDELDTLTENGEVRDSAYPVGVIERQKKDGTWANAGGWDVRPRDLTSAPVKVDYTAERTAEMLAVAAINDEADRKDRRRSYYLRTGR